MTGGGIRAHWNAIRASYWFVPSIMALAAVALGIVMIWVDATLGSSWIDGLGWYQQVRADGAREVLSTIAGSMITVAGVVFSITIVALSYASGQYGPRVLTNFMTDRGNTITLGTFVATFLYCLVVLRTIRGGDEDFVPQYAVLVAMLLAVCSIGVLIYFIHHVLQSIHVNTIVAWIGRRLVEDTKHRFPDRIGAAPAEGPREIPRLHGKIATVCSGATGYIQSIESERILDIARRQDVCVRLRLRPGDFVVCGRALVELAPSEHWSEDCDAELRECFTVGDKRTPDDDLMFLVSELVEIAARALSPGVNDPMTAVTCLDWLGAGATEFASRQVPSPVRLDKGGVPRLIARPNDFSFFMRRSFGRLRPYVSGDELAALRFLSVVGELRTSCRSPDQIDVLRAEVALFAEQAGHDLAGPAKRVVEQRAEELQALLARGIDETGAGHLDWVGGTA